MATIEIAHPVRSTVAKHFDSLDANARELFDASMRWMEKYWDEPAGLLLGSEGEHSAPHHTIRGSVWYAFGLLMRNRGGDSARAVRVIDTVLNYQFDAPERVFHGSFFRAPEEPYPPTDAVIWRDYDPNWREFNITALQLVLREYAERLPGTLVQKIDVAIRQAVTGALARGLSATYTNIALMYAFMLCDAGLRFNELSWFAEGERMAREVYGLFKQHDAFAEYNSPTYYGTDMYALALWRAYPALSPLLAQLGAEMESLLWQDIARFYHAGLQNLAGPYDRSYGMDMRRYVSVIGIWMALALGKKHAPLPDTDRLFEHEHDLAFVPLVAFLGARVPPDALAHLSKFQGERQIERVISDAPRRVATAWLGKDRMIGGEFTSRTAPQSNQLHAGTIHWRIDAEDIGWIRVLYAAPVDAQARKNQLEIATKNEIAFLIYAPGTPAERIARDCWSLPRLSVRVETNAARMDVQPRADLFGVRYTVPADQPISCTLTVL